MRNALLAAKKRKKQTRITVPYFLFWTRAMTIENGDLSDVIPIVQVVFNIYFHPWEPIEIYELQKLEMMTPT